MKKLIIVWFLFLVVFVLMSCDDTVTNENADTTAETCILTTAPETSEKPVNARAGEVFAVSSGETVSPIVAPVGETVYDIDHVYMGCALGAGGYLCEGERDLSSIPTLIYADDFRFICDDGSKEVGFSVFDAERDHLYSGNDWSFIDSLSKGSYYIAGSFVWYGSTVDDTRLSVTNDYIIRLIVE